ncbi:winged helix-turn-helix domain-containing protein [Hwanghaeella sp.]|uniref:winged helix-turn-helix domain-containing protein n=1 Tax=Hwanghaeella sp. TaxID=2605943 RepID=UPI003CCBFF7E
MAERTNVHHLPSADREVIDFLISETATFSRPDLCRRFPPAVVDRLFEGGHLHEAITADCRSCAVVAPLTIQELGSLPPWLPYHDTLLKHAWRSGEPVLSIAGRIDRTGGEVLSRAWELDLAQRPKGRKELGLNVPAWRVRRLRWMLLEAERRGIDPDDRGEDLKHRALRLRFEGARKAVLALKRRTQRPWRTPDKLMLRSMIRSGHTIWMMAKVFERRVEDIAHQVAIEGRHIPVRWTEDEDRTLINALRSGMSEEGAARLLPNRTIIAVNGRARQLLPDLYPYKRPAEWTELETRKLIDGYENGLRGLALYTLFPGRTWQAARRQLHKYKFEHDKDAPATVTEIRILNAAFKRDDTDEEIARFLVWDVERVARFRKAQSRMRGGGREPKIREPELRKMRSLKRDGKYTNEEIARRLGVSPSTFYRHQKRMVEKASERP